MLNNTTDEHSIKEYMSLLKSQKYTYRYLKARLKKLIIEKVEISRQDSDGSTLLHLAIKLNDMKLLKLFLESGVNPNLANDNNNAPIHLAILKNNLDALKLLIEYKCDVCLPSDFEETPLHLAVSESNLEAIKLLVENGADFNLVDENNCSVIDYVVDESNEDVVKYFLSCAIDEDHAAILKEIIDR